MTPRLGALFALVLGGSFLWGVVFGTDLEYALRFALMCCLSLLWGCGTGDLRSVLPFVTSMIVLFTGVVVISFVVMWNYLPW